MPRHRAVRGDGLPKRQPPLVGAGHRPRAWRALAVIHPVPSVIDAVLVAALAVVAGGGPATGAVLAVAMLGFQSSIGALNDIVDAPMDRVSKPWKPVPAGQVSVRLAAAFALAGAIVGAAVCATFGPMVLLLGLAGYGCGVAYDVSLRGRGLGWLCFAAAFPILIAWTWLAAAGTMPPGWPIILPVAALAGPALHLANSLVDAGADDRVGRRSLATRLGPRRARWALAVLMALVLLLAWSTLGSMPGLTPFGGAAALGGTAAVAVGVGLSWRASWRSREAGWLLQACGLSILAVVWLASMSLA